MTAVGSVDVSAPASAAEDGPIHSIVLGGPAQDELLAFEGAATYRRGDLDARARTTAWLLRRLGVEPGARVAVMLPNCIEYIDVILATSMLGAVVVPLHVALRGEMLARAVALAEPTLFVADQRLAELWAPVIDRDAVTMLTVGDGDDDRGSSRLLVGIPQPWGSLADHELPAVAADRPVIVYASSGTTGPAKGVTLCHAALVEMSRTSQIVMNYGPSDVAYTPMPLFHANAFVFTFLGAARAGARTIIAEHFHTTGFWERMARLGVTKTSLLGSAPSLLVRQPESEFDRAHHVELIAAVPRPIDVDDFEARFGVVVTEFYGSTEANLPIAIPYGERRSRSCGRLLPGWQYMLADERDRPVSAGEPGELCIRPDKPNVVSSGYWGEPERTIEMWRNLWVHTGDMMRVDADGWFFFIDRIKDAIRVSGENVASADVEAAVVSAAGVAEAAAFGVVSEYGEQDVMVAVVLAAPGTATPQEIVDHCRRHLPYFAVPRYVDIVESLPRTPTAKLRKGVLREHGVTASTVDLGRPRRQEARP